MQGFNNFRKDTSSFATLQNCKQRMGRANVGIWGVCEDMGGKFTPVLHQMRELWNNDVKWGF
ncbi:hypothetical protein D7V86_05100 [bacterium D16-51]|nr:hypothetical protein D7V96_12715 [bacterium D16-59]RKI61439.1 hypothetical protein D7V86_05100 [bacterium D16-51]